MNTGVNYTTQRTADNAPSSSDKSIRMAFSSLPSRTATRPITDTLSDDDTSVPSPTVAIVVVVMGAGAYNPSYRSINNHLFTDSHISYIISTNEKQDLL